MSEESNTPSVPQRLMGWVEDVQLSARVGVPHYANPGELKRDIRELVEQSSALKETAERVRDAWLLYENGVDDAHLTSACADLDKLLVAQGSRFFGV